MRCLFQFVSPMKYSSCDRVSGIASSESARVFDSVVVKPRRSTRYPRSSTERKPRKVFIAFRVRPRSSRMQKTSSRSSRCCKYASEKTIKSSTKQAMVPQAMWRKLLSIRRCWCWGEFLKPIIATLNRLWPRWETMPARWRSAR